MTYRSDHELTMEALRHRIDRAEIELQRDRLALEEYYATMQLPTANMFSWSLFVRRSAAAGWVAKARAEGFEAGRRAAKKITGDQGEDDTNDRDDPDDKGDDDHRKRGKKAKPVEDGDEEAAARAVHTTAEAIVLAAKRARTGQGSSERPTEPIARKILNMGCRRRGEPERF